MTNLKELQDISDNLKERSNAMPMLFVGHGSPMNGIEDNEFSRRWGALGKELPIPSAVLCISAHWYTRGSFVTAMEEPQTIHDYYGFPPEMYAVHYPAPGSPAVARQMAALATKTDLVLDHEWGLDHGCWSVVKNMYPQADIPVLQLSIDGTKSPQWHYELASDLHQLRSKGVLIIGSGNMVHNLRMVDWQHPDNGYDWAVEMNSTFKQLIEREEHAKLMHYSELGSGASLSIPTPDHYLPLLYILGLKKKNEQIEFFNDKLVMGSVSMTSVKVGK